jgi:hypothetical protein
MEANCSIETLFFRLANGIVRAFDRSALAYLEGIVEGKVDTLLSPPCDHAYYQSADNLRRPTSPPRMTTFRFFWNLLLAGVVVLIATRVGIVLDRDSRLSVAAKWTILVAVVAASAFLLSLLSLLEP